MTVRDYRQERIDKKKKRKKILIISGVILALLLIAFGVAANVFTIRSVEVEGNAYYTAEEIENLIITDVYTRNSLYLMWKMRRGEIDIPFVSAIEIELYSASEIKVRVYEKSLVGYIEYLGTNMYFDEDGVIVESSSEVLDDVPFVSGLEFSKITLYQKLPIKNEVTFNTILNLTKLLKKSEIAPDKIHFDSKQEITLYFDDVKVLLGQDENIEAKIARLYALLPDLEGLSGTLYMENFTQDTTNITFKPD